ncbi:hypothetical protein IG631_21058 [Alternaria alternata]|nr:hypothetical protein IG631_21058 [Alternaria alternata]
MSEACGQQTAISVGEVRRTYSTGEHRVHQTRSLIGVPSRTDSSIGQMLRSKTSWHGSQVRRFPLTTVNMRCWCCQCLTIFGALAFCITSRAETAKSVRRM